MTKTWMKRILAGTRTFDEVPKYEKDNVKQLLHDAVDVEYMSNGELFTKEKYEEIVGEPF